MTNLSNIDRPVRKIQRYHTLLHWATRALVVATLASLATTVLWGIVKTDWAFVVAFGACILSLALLGVSLVVARRVNTLSDGACHKCGGVILGKPPEDVVLACEDCGQEWFVVGTGDSEGAL